MRSILSKALDSEGNTKLVNKSYAGSYRLVAIHENKEIDLHYSIIGQNNWIVSYDSGKKLYHSGEDKSARIRWEYHAEVIDGVGWLTHGLYSAYPSKYSSEEPKEGPSYYFAYRFSIETGRIYQGIGIDDNNNFVFNYVDAGYTLDTQGINGPEKISVKHADWDSPSDDTSGSYLDFRNLFQHIIEPNSSKTVDNKSYIGEFKAGVIEGKGFIKYPDNEMYEGDFKNGFPHGQGVQLLPDNTKLMGKFHEGAFVPSK